MALYLGLLIIIESSKPRAVYVLEASRNIPEGPSTQYLRTLVPKAINGMVLGPSGHVLACDDFKGKIVDITFWCSCGQESDTVFTPCMPMLFVVALQL